MTSRITFVQLLLVLLMGLQLQGCASTVYSWREQPEEERVLQNYTLQEKQDYYRKFGIYTIDRYAFRTYTEPEKSYTNTSFDPFFFARVPRAEMYLANIDNYQRVQVEIGNALDLLFSVALIVPASLYFPGAPEIGVSSESLSFELLKMAVVIVAHYGLLQLNKAFFAGPISAEYEKLRVEYNASLRESLGLDASSLDTVPAPSLMIEE